MDRASNATVKQVIKSLNEIIKYDDELNGVEINLLSDVINTLERLRD